VDDVPQRDVRDQPRRLRGTVIGEPEFVTVLVDAVRFKLRLTLFVGREGGVEDDQVLVRGQVDLVWPCEPLLRPALLDRGIEREVPKPRVGERRRIGGRRASSSRRRFAPPAERKLRTGQQPPETTTRAT
jgi:hypothetical protein